MQDDQQEEFPFIEGNLDATPWAAIIIDRSAADDMETSGEIEWTGDFYRLCDRPVPEVALSWLAAISARIEGLALNPYDYRVLAHLIWRSGAKGTCWPSYESIASVTGISRRRVATSLANLVKRRIVDITRGGHAGVSNVYRIRGELALDPVIPGDVGEAPLFPDDDEEEETPAPIAAAPGSKPAAVDLFGESLETASGDPNELFAIYLPEELKRNVDVMLALGRFEKSRREMRKKMTPTAVRTLCRKIKEWSPEAIIDAATTAVEKGWLTLYEPTPKVTPEAWAKEKDRAETAGSKTPDVSGWKKGGSQ